VALSDLANAFIGMCLIFASVALLVSSVTEGLASLLKLRSATLLEGLKSMLNAPTTKPSILQRFLPPLRFRLAGDPAGPPGVLPQWLRTALRCLRLLPAEAPAAVPVAVVPDVAPAQPPNPFQPKSGPQLLRDLFNHAAIAVRGPGDGSRLRASTVPSYITPDQFAAALIDVVFQGRPRTPGAEHAAPLEGAIRAVSDPQLQRLLQGAAARAENDLQKFHDEVAKWFDSTMDRVGGDYKRYIQLWSFLIGLGVAILFNIDGVAIVKALLTNPLLAASVQVSGADLAKLPDLTKLQGFGVPIGWHTTAQSLGEFLELEWTRMRDHSLEAASHVAGWLIIAAASLFGAPFWFDTLQLFVKLRGTGDKPEAPAKPAAEA
jgi:hypothetical protein